MSFGGVSDTARECGSGKLEQGAGENRPGRRGQGVPEVRVNMTGRRQEGRDRTGGSIADGRR